jgi:hypothetical protein
VGAAPNSDGGIPDIYVKGEYGYRLAEYSNAKKHMNGGSSQQYVIDNLSGIDLKPQVLHPIEIFPFPPQLSAVTPLSLHTIIVPPRLHSA